MTDLKLPELPNAALTSRRTEYDIGGESYTATADYYTAAQLTAYATAAILADRAAREGDAALLDALGSFVEAEGGLVLHTGVLRGNYGGLWVGGGRTLRDALRSCFPEAGGGDDAR